MKFNTVDPSTFEVGNPDLDELKAKLASAGVHVHHDMVGPTDSYEVFTNGIGEKIPVLAPVQGIVYEDTPVDAVANFIIRTGCTHFAFYQADAIFHKELLTGKNLTAFTLRFALWK